MKTTEFYFFSTSFFVQTLNNDIFPAEIAMSKFSLAAGVKDTLHMLVNPGPLPLGKASEAMSYANERHKRKLPPNIDGETDYNKIFEKMMKFLGASYAKREKIPLIFVDPGMNDDDYKTAKMTLEKIVRESGEDEMHFRLYPFEQLLFRLHKKCFNVRTVISSVSMARDMSARDKFMYSDLGCAFHREEDANLMCCLSKVKRLGFLLASYCLSDNDVKILGRHMPEEDSFENPDDEAPLYKDDVDSSYKDDGWSSLADSFKNLKVESKTLSHSSIPSLSLNSSLTSVFSQSEGLKIQKKSRNTADSFYADSLPTIDSQASFSSLILASRPRQRSLFGERRGAKH